MKRIGITIFSISLATIFLPQFARAASATWSATPTDGNWVTDGTETNWSTGLGTFPGATAGLTNPDTATFTGTSTQLNIVINSATLNIKNITFSGSSEPAYTIGSTVGNSLFLTSGGTISIASTTSGINTANTVNAPLVLEPATNTTAGSYTFSSASATASHPLVIGGSVTGGTTSQGISLTLTGANTGANAINGAISNGGANAGLSITKTSGGSWTLSNTNSYSGGTTISGGTLIASKDGALGSGNVSLTAASVTLTLQSGATNNYIADTASLSIGFTTDVVNLTYTGTDTIAGLTINGVTEAPGVYGSAASGAPNPRPEFTGLGTLTVIPEPATSMLLGFGLLLGAQRLRRKRS